MDGRAAVLRARLFPLKDVRTSQIEDALRELASVELVNTYSVDGKPFVRLPGWDRHQQIRAKKSKYPAPDETCNQMISSDYKCPRNPIQSESNPNPNPEAESKRARTDADDDRPDFNTVEVYATNNLASMTAGNMEEFASFKADLSEELIRHAIDDTCAHGSRNWAYTRVLLQRYVEKGYKSIADVQKAAEERRKGIKTAANNPAGARQNYTQREYGDDFGFYNPAEDYA
jgi:DnaD/phage-associated family protein